MTSLGTYWRTLRHLKPRQFTGRVVFKLARPTANLAAPPQCRHNTGPWVVPAARSASLLAPQRFCFLGVAGDLSTLGWAGPAAEKLWRYNQHYFDDLNAQDAVARRAWHMALIEAWAQQNPPGEGDGWEPYPLSLRIVNWLKAYASGLSLVFPWTFTNFFKSVDIIDKFHISKNIVKVVVCLSSLHWSP